MKQNVQNIQKSQSKKDLKNQVLVNKLTSQDSFNNLY